MCINRAVGRRLPVRLRAGDDHGLTLVELLVTIAILGVIAVPLGAAFITYFQHLDDINERLSVSHDSQIAASYFAQDVASLGRHDWSKDGFPLAQSVFVNVAPGAGPYACGPAGAPNATIRLVWDDPSVAKLPPVLRVAYVVTTIGTEKQLHRFMCDGTGGLVSDVVIAHNLDSVDTPVCAPKACTDVSDPLYVPQTVQLTLHLKSPNPNIPDTLTVTLYGQRRQT